MKSRKLPKRNIPTVGEALGLTSRGRALLSIVRDAVDPFLEEQEKKGISILSLANILKQYAGVIETDAANLMASSTFKTLAWKRKDW